MFLSERNLKIGRALKGVAEKAGRAPAQVAIRWLLQRPGNVIPIIGARNRGQLLELLGASEFSLEPELIAELDAATAIDVGYPGSLLTSPAGQGMVHGSLLAQLERR